MNKNTSLLLNRLSELPFKNEIQLTLFKQKTKNPFLENWINDPNTKYNIEETKKQLNNNSKQNIGLMHNNHFIVIDIDSELSEDNLLYMAVKEIFKPTFMTKTAKGCHAIYIATDEIPKTHIELKKDNVVYGEYRHNNHHVVEAGSIHPTGVEYTVFSNNKIETFDIKDFDDLMKLFDIKYKESKKKPPTKPEITLNNIIQQKNKTTLDDVAKLINVDIKQFQEKTDNDGNIYFNWKGTLPNHESEGGKHAVVKYFVDSGHVAWNCFQHIGDDSKRNFKTLKAMVEGHCSCEETADNGRELIQNIKLEEKETEFQQQLEQQDDSKLLVDKIIKDPIHDLLLKFKVYNFINKKKETPGAVQIYTEEQIHSYRIIEYLIQNDCSVFVKEIIKYASKSEYEDFNINHKTGFKQSYYSIINDFIFTTNKESYNDFIQSFNSQQTVETINYDIIKDYFSNTDFKAYSYNLDKWFQGLYNSFTSSNFDDILTSTPKIEYLIDNFLGRASTMMISSDPKVGKTFFAMQIQLSLALGRDFLGQKTSPTSVCYFDMENTVNIMYPRYKGFFNGLDLTPEEKELLSKNIHLQTKNNDWGFIKSVNNTLEADTGMINDSLSFCLKNNVKVVIFDPLVNMGQFQETNEDFTFLKQTVINKFIENDIAVIILHHHTKSKDKNGKATARGGSALVGAVNTAYSLYKVDDNRRILEATNTRSGEISRIEYDIDITETYKEDNTKEYKHIKLTKVERLGGLLPEQQAVLEAMEQQEYYTTEEFKTLLLENNLIRDDVIHWKKPREVKIILNYIDQIKWKDHNIRDGKVPTNGVIYMLKKPKLLGDDEDE